MNIVLICMGAALIIVGGVLEKFKILLTEEEASLLEIKSEAFDAHLSVSQKNVDQIYAQSFQDLNEKLIALEREVSRLSEDKQDKVVACKQEVKVEPMQSKPLKLNEMMEEKLQTYLKLKAQGKSLEEASLILGIKKGELKLLDNLYKSIQ